MSIKKLLYLSAREVREALSMAEAVDVMKKAFIELSFGRAEVPLRTHIDAPSSCPPTFREKTGWGSRSSRSSTRIPSRGFRDSRP